MEAIVRIESVPVLLPFFRKLAPLRNSTQSIIVINLLIDSISSLLPRFHIQCILSLLPVERLKQFMSEELSVSRSRHDQCLKVRKIQHERFYEKRPSSSQARSLRSDRVSVSLELYVRSVRSLRSDRTLPKHRYDTNSCILVYPTMLSPEDRSELSSFLPTILRHQSNFAVKTVESLFFIERSRNKRFESEDGPKGSKTRLEAQLTIS
ncbi:hypothetical protein YC2023_071490 [Brassica napus]